jgi:hypothetical protein
MVTYPNVHYSISSIESIFSAETICAAVNCVSDAVQKDVMTKGLPLTCQTDVEREEVDEVKKCYVKQESVE